jgi:hypothetical protein
MKGMTETEMTALYESLKNAGMLDDSAAAVVDAQIEVERQADHERRRQARGTQAVDEGLVDQLRERITHLEEVVAWQGKALAELTAIHKQAVQDSDHDWLCYTDPAKWRAEQAYARTVAAAAGKPVDPVSGSGVFVVDIDKVLGNPPYGGPDAQGPRLIKEIMAK